jgi:hypothetical protein
MAKYLLLKHYRGAPASVNDVPMDAPSSATQPAPATPQMTSARVALGSCIRIR